MAIQSRSVRIERYFTASPEDVFDAWLDPTMLAQWMFDPQYRNQRIETIQLDARVGGQFTFKLWRDGSRITYTGRYLELLRPERLILTWRTVGHKNITRVDVTIKPHERGAILTLVHDLGRVPDQIAQDVESDWNADFSSLAKVLQ